LEAESAIEEEFERIGGGCLCQHVFTRRERDEIRVGMETKRRKVRSEQGVETGLKWG